MVDTTPDQLVISLQGQLAGIVAAMNMHIKRAEELAAEMEQIQAELNQVPIEAFK